MKTVWLIFGGFGPEKEVSNSSGIGIFRNICKKRYKVIPISISPLGFFKVSKDNPLWESNDTLPVFTPTKSDEKLTTDWSNENDPFGIQKPDVIFHIVHGEFGEDGTLNGLLDYAFRKKVRIIGPSITGSTNCYDKEMCKRILEDAGVKTAPYFVASAQSFGAIKKEDFPLFVKASKSGSSRGVNKAANFEELERAIDDAKNYDDKVIIEKEIEGQEIECAVLSTLDGIKCATPGEILKDEVDGWYSFEAKYTRGSKTIIPANLSIDKQNECKQIAIKCFEILELKGLSRVDLFVTKNGDVIVNEINTLPGFTPISMFPKMWEFDGLSYKQLLTTLINFELER